MHREALLPNIGQEGRPVAEELTVYPGFFALTDIFREVHKHIAASDSGISRKVPQSAFAYYTGVLCYARLLKVAYGSARPLTCDEEEFMRLVYEGDFRPPEPIAFYLQGLGCTTLQNQREIRFRMRPRRYVAFEDGSFGWFGRVDGNTYYLYASYPCLAVLLNGYRKISILRIIQPSIQSGIYQMTSLRWMKKQVCQPLTYLVMHLLRNYLTAKFKWKLIVPELRLTLLRRLLVDHYPRL